jgi:hypothetical protein
MEALAEAAVEGAKVEGQKVKYGDTMHPIGSEQSDDGVPAFPAVGGRRGDGGRRMRRPYRRWGGAA